MTLFKKKKEILTVLMLRVIRERSLLINTNLVYKILKQSAVFEKTNDVELKY